MMGGSESGSGDKDGLHTVTIHVPIGWQRRVEDGLVVYISPSGTLLSSLEEVRSYLLTDGTCKCGLECPLVIHKVFNFSVGIKVQQHSQPAGKCEQDMTKLCNHRRKVVAMAALCRSMQASQMPYVARHPDVTSGSMEHKIPQRMRVDRDEEERVTYPSKHHLVQSRPNSIVTPNPCASPKNSPHLVYSYNGSSPLLHAVTNSPHSPEVLRRLPPPLHLPATGSQFTGYGTPQRSPRTPTPHILGHGLRTPHTPEGPRSPHLGPLSLPPPSSSPVTMGRGGHLHGVVGSPLSPSCSPSPSVSMSCPSPRQRSRHPSASSSYSEPGLGGAVLAGYPPRRISSSPHSPLPGGSPNLHFPKYKLEDILEQFRNSGNSSTNNHILHQNSLCNQSHPQILSLALEKSGKPTKALGSGSGTAVTAGPSGMPLGKFLNHQKQPHPASFPASSLLSAAAKAQLASQMTHSQSPSLEISQESQQSKVTNSTLYNNSHPSIARPPPAASLLPPQPCAPPSQPSASSPLHLSSTDRTSHRKRQRRSPTVLSMLKDSQMSGPRSHGDALNLSALHSQPSSTSASPHPVTPESHLQALRLSVRHPGALSGSQKLPDGALDFTTIVAGQPDPPTQPLSALLHLLSVQNAQAAAAQPGSGNGGGVTRHSPRESPSPSHLNVRPTRSPSQPYNSPSPSQTKARRSSAGAPSPSGQQTQPSPVLRWSPSGAQSSPRLGSPSPTQHPPDRLRQAQNHHADAAATVVRSPPPDAGASSEISTLSPGLSPAHPPSSAPSSSHGTAITSYSSTTTSPRPLDLSNHVLALLAASSNAHPGDGSLDRNAGSCGPAAPESRVVDHQSPAPTKPSGGCSPDPSPCQPPALGDASGSSPLAEAFPFMNQEQLLQLLSATAGLPSLLDSTVLGSLPMALWMSGQQGHLPASNTPQPHHHLPEQQQPSEHQQNLLLPHEEHQEKQPHHHQQNAHMNHSFPFSLLPSLVGGQGELPLNLLGLLNPLPPPSATPTPGQEADLGMGEKIGLQALLMASLLLGQQQAAMLPLSGLGQLSLDLPLHQQHIPALLEGLCLDKSSGLPDLSSLPVPGLLEALQGLLPPAEGHLQALQSLLLPSPLPPQAFLSLSPALLTAALGSNDLPPAQLHPTQQTQQPPSQVSASDADGGVDTLIPLSVQGKDNPVLHQLLPTLLNPGLLGDLSALTSLHSLLGLGAGPLLLPPVQASALGMALIQDPDGAINLLNNLQLNVAPSTEGEKSVSLQETDSSAPQEDIPANRHTPEAGLAASPVPASQREGSVGSILDPYASFMDTIYTSFLQVSAKEQEASQSGADTLCALPPSYPEEPPAPSTPLPQASAPLSLSPRRACSLRNSDLSRLSMEAAHSPAQGTPKPNDDCSATPQQIKPGVPEARTNPPLPPIYLEEAKTDSYSQAVSDRQGEGHQAGEYPSPRDEAVGLQQTKQNQTAQTGGARRGRKRKQTLQNVLEDFRDLDASVLEEPNPTVVLLKPERSVRGRRRRGARSQRQ